MKTMRPIRKYGNRKLYDETSARYVSMVELSDLVAEGSRVKVTCDLTGNDLTVETLARALYERSKVVKPSDREAAAGAISRVIEKCLR